MPGSGIKNVMEYLEYPSSHKYEPMLGANHRGRPLRRPSATGAPLPMIIMKDGLMGDSLITAFGQTCRFGSTKVGCSQSQTTVPA
jgi:hypothetical protein